MGAHVELISVAPADLASWEPAWRELERQAPDAPPFACFDWLAAWAREYAPSRLAVVMAGSPPAPSALGLLELGAGGRWHFGGRPVTATRGLLATPGEEAAAWAGLGEWLRAHPRRWATLSAESVASGVAEALPGGRGTPADAFAMALPESFEDYLAARSSRTRANFRKAPRLVERGGAELRDADDIEGALADFVRLHTARAESLGERHPAIGPPLARMLGALVAAPSLDLRVFELVRDGRRLGVSLSVHRGAVAWDYNLGIDPEALDLEPGVALQLHAIRDAIERGRRRSDLGPGGDAHKRRLGGEPDDRVDVRAAGPTARGRVVGGLERLRDRVRR